MFVIFVMYDFSFFQLNSVIKYTNKDIDRLVTIFVLYSVNKKCKYWNGLCVLLFYCIYQTQNKLNWSFEIIQNYKLVINNNNINNNNNNLVIK